MGLACCVDFGSTFTKALLVDTGSGALLASASHHTTIGTDVLDGYDACLVDLERTHPGARDAEVLACSSAGGGLRIAVVGNEELVTAEAGRRVALSSGGKVVLVLSGGLDPAKYAQLDASAPDVLLLVGGTDGGNSEVLEQDARFLAGQHWRAPVVVAGNLEAQGAVATTLEHAGTPYVLADNVVPRIGVLAPQSARAAIREMFLAHVIGGKQLSSRAVFSEMVRGATPDVVLTGVELLAGAEDDQGGADGVVVVDIGGATTDVHSVVRVDPETTTGGGLSREVVATTPLTRTVEGDLGMRWSAVSTLDAAIDAGLLDDDLRSAARRRQDDPAYLPDSDAERDTDERLATAAAVIAMRRHVGRSQVVLGPDGRVVQRSGTDLREADVLVGSGGVLRNSRPEVARRILAAATGSTSEGWQQPEQPGIAVDRCCVLAAAGLLAERFPGVAARLARSVVPALT